MTSKLPASDTTSSLETAASFTTFEVPFITPENLPLWSAEPMSFRQVTWFCNLSRTRSSEHPGHPQIPACPLPWSLLPLQPQATRFLPLLSFLDISYECNHMTHILFFVKTHVGPHHFRSAMLCGCCMRFLHPTPTPSSVSLSFHSMINDFLRLLPFSLHCPVRPKYLRG